MAEKKKRKVRNSEYMVLSISTGALPHGEPSPKWGVEHLGNEIAHASSKDAEDAIVQSGDEQHDYLVVRVQKGPIRLRQVRKLV